MAPVDDFNTVLDLVSLLNCISSIVKLVDTFHLPC